MSRENKIRILCVAGDRKVLRGLQASLDADFEVAGARSGREGLAMLATVSVDWVLLHCRSAGMTAAEFLHSASRLDGRPGFILVSGSPIPRPDWECLRPLGVRGSMDESVDPDFLRAVIRTDGRLKGGPVDGRPGARPCLVRI